LSRPLGRSPAADARPARARHLHERGGLEAKGGNLFLETSASGAADRRGAPGEPGFGTLNQGFVEASNVNPVAEITALITAQRAYEMNSRVVKTADEMLATTSQLR
jgi:flagellar basal-body rod protein FlgG